MTCERHGGNAGSIMCRECDLETIERDAMTTPNDLGHACSPTQDCTAHNLHCGYPECAKGRREGVHARPMTTPTPTPTPTPRTDALTKRMAGELDRPMLQQNHFIELCDHSRQLERDLAAAQEANKRLEACVHGEVPAGALNALGRWLAPVLDEDKWATAEPMLNAALLQLLEAQEARKAAEKTVKVLDEVGRQLGRKLAEEIDERKAAEARAEQNAKDAKEAIAIAGFLFDAWEDGTPCFETDGESGMGASIGKAFKLSNEDFTRCTEFLNRVDPRGAAIDAAIAGEPS